MTHTPSANELAAREERREHSWRDELQPPRPEPRAATSPVWGTLTLWASAETAGRGEDWIIQSDDIHIDLSRPGVLITYDRSNCAEIFVLQPGWYFNFLPVNDEG